MKSYSKMIIVSLSIAIALSGCATLLRGYQGELIINNAPENLTVSTIDGVNLVVKDKLVWLSKTNPIDRREKIYYGSINANIKVVELPSNKSYVLILRDQLTETRIEVHPKIGLGWFFLDTVFGIIPIIPDAITGNWYYYSPVEYLAK